MAAMTEWSGRKLACPACKKEILIPPPPKETEEKPAAPAEARKPEPAAAAKAEGPVGKDETAPAKAEAPAAAPAKAEEPVKPSAASAEGGAEEEKGKPPLGATPDRLRVAVLNAEVKKEIVRGVRERIRDEAHWIAGVTENDEFAYAARMENGKLAYVEATNPEAERFSLIGAFLREFSVKNVATDAEGRTRLLNEEIPRAIRRVIYGEPEEGKPDPGEGVPQKKLLALTHAQSLETLDALEDSYARRAVEKKAAEVKRKLPSVSVEELAGRLEKDGRVTPEEITAALYHEMLELRLRLEKVERAAARAAGESGGAG